MMRFSECTIGTHVRTDDDDQRCGIIVGHGSRLDAGEVKPVVLVELRDADMIWPEQGVTTIAILATHHDNITRRS